MFHEVRKLICVSRLLAKHALKYSGVVVLQKSKAILFCDNKTNFEMSVILQQAVAVFLPHRFLVVDVL